MSKSISEIISGMIKRDKEKVEDTEKQVDSLIEKALVQTDEYRIKYREMANRAIYRVQQASKNGNAAERAIGMRELKMSYGLYRNMDALHNAYHMMESRRKIEGVLSDFGKVVDGMSMIRVHSGRVDIDKLTAKALRSTDMLDTSKLDDMVDKLINASVGQSSTDYATDAFLEQLVRGEVTLDTPYQAQPVAATSEAGQAVQTTTAETDNMEAMFAELLKGLS